MLITIIIVNLIKKYSLVVKNKKPISINHKTIKSITIFNFIVIKTKIKQWMIILLDKPYLLLKITENLLNKDALVVQVTRDNNI